MFFNVWGEVDSNRHSSTFGVRKVDHDACENLVHWRHQKNAVDSGVANVGPSIPELAMELVQELAPELVPDP